MSHWLVHLCTIHCPLLDVARHFLRQILSKLCWCLKHTNSNPKRSATGPTEVVWRADVKVPRQHPLRAKLITFKEQLTVLKRIWSSSWRYTELDCMTLFWERSMILFKMEKNPTNIPPHCFCGSLNSRSLTMRTLGTKALCLLTFFSYLGYFFQISFVKVKPTSYLNDHPFWG